MDKLLKNNVDINQGQKICFKWRFRTTKIVNKGKIGQNSKLDISNVDNKQSTPAFSNKIKNDYKPVYFTKPEQGGTLVIGAGNNPIKGAYNIDKKS